MKTRIWIVVIAVAVLAGAASDVLVGGMVQLAGTTILSAPADGKLAIKKAAGTGLTIDATTADLLAMGKTDGTTLLSLNGGRAASITADMNTLARQTILTVPSGKTFEPEAACVGPCSEAISAATAGFGSDTPAQDFKTATLITLTSAGNRLCFVPSSGVETPSVAAAGTFAIDLTVVEGSGTCTVAVYGSYR